MNDFIRRSRSLQVDDPTGALRRAGTGTTIGSRCDGASATSAGAATGAHIIVAVKPASPAAPAVTIVASEVPSSPICEASTDHAHASGVTVAPPSGTSAPVAILEMG
jgi:hypothetical protein